MSNQQHHGNMVHSSSGSNSNGSTSMRRTSQPGSSSATTAPPTVAHLTTGQGDGIIIPLSAADLNALRANCIIGSSDGSVGGVSAQNLNVSVSGGHIVVNTAGGADGNALNSLVVGSTNGLSNQLAVASVANILHSNEITSNGINDSQVVNISNRNGHQLEGSSTLREVLTSGQQSQQALAVGNTSGQISTTNLSIDEAGIISASNLLSSQVNVLNQTGIVSGSEMVAFGNLHSSNMEGIGINGQQLNHQHHQQQEEQQEEVSSLVDGNNMMAVTASLHKGLDKKGRLGKDSGLGQNEALSGLLSSRSSTTDSELGSRKVTATNSSNRQLQQQQEQQQHQIWMQPDQSSFVPTAASLAAIACSSPQGSLTLRGSQGSISIQDASSSQTALAGIQPGSLSELQQAQLSGSQLPEVRTQFSGVFQIPQASRSETFQAPAHSTLGDASPAPAYREIKTDSEATPSFPSLQHISVENGASIMAGPTVDSSALPQGYSLIYDQENRTITVQRMMSPSDCTVSQSTLSLEGSEAQSNQGLLPMTSQSGSSYTMVQVSLPSFHSGATSEVSTSSMVAALGVSEGSSSSEVHSLAGALSSSETIMVLPKLESDLNGAPECDTTQEEIDFPHPRSPAYIDTSNNLDEEQSLDSTGLHSTMQGSGGVTSASVIMDSTLNSSDLTPLHSMGMQGVGQREVVLQGQHHEQTRPGLCSSNSDSFNVEESMPGSSGLFSGSTSETVPSRTANTHHLRKSRRLELNQEVTLASQRKRDYRLDHYDPNLLWCEECMAAYDTECTMHRPILIPDKIVKSRAWASAPNQIQIFRVPEAQLEPGDSALGAYAKRVIPKYTQFGPFVGELVDSLSQVTNNAFVLMLEFGETRRYFETQDENKCNWMMFVRPAKTFAEQNLVAFQHKEDVYFTATKTIDNKQELKVWYSAPYAERVGLKTLMLTEEDMQALDEQNAKFPCFECSRKFKTSAALQKHLSTHDAEDLRDLDGAGGDDEDFTANISRFNDKSGAKKKATMVRGKLLRGKNRSNAENTGSYQWKKKSTSIYLNRTLKKYKRRPASEKTLANMKSMYKRQGKDSGGNEWMCMHCGLTYDNASLLNLHTLTHAAENIDMDDIRKLACEPKIEFSSPNLADQAQENVVSMANVITIGESQLVCPKCNAVFDSHLDLMSHVETHAHKRSKPYPCGKCNKSFSTNDKLDKHQLVHGDEASKPLECHVCQKRLMNNSALACHLKTHSSRKYYECPVCNKDFDMVSALKDHSSEHMDGQGNFPCTQCRKVFDDFSQLKKHMKALHSDKVFACVHCGKEFPRVDKLKLHMLRHTTHREFMCETCGRQFKRKDKLKEHMKRVHSKERMEQKLRAKQSLMEKKFTPKVMPTEYHRFIYKCHTCLLGFKRRGMLVNHLAKRHPEIKPEQVPELNLPILKTQKDFYCQYCEKIYKSSSKRKAHILKNHPGLLVPPSTRKRMCPGEVGNGGTFANQSFSHTVASITTMPHGCKFCHKQYASKAKLLQHQRKKHVDLVEPPKRKVKARNEFLQLSVAADPNQNMAETTVPITIMGAQSDTLPSADLLTQAMSELHNYTSEFSINPRNNTTMVQIQSGQLQPTTIDISQLNQALQSFTSQQGGVATVIAPPAQPASPTQQTGVTVVGTPLPQTINIGNTQFITRNWSNGFATQFR